MFEMTQREGSTPDQLGGPRVEPKSGGAPKQLVIFLHGVGSDGNDLIQIAPLLQDALPDAAFFSPHGPYPCDIQAMGRQWFSFMDDNYEPIGKEVEETYFAVDRHIDKEMANLGLPASKIALVGFSQGGITALQTGLRRPEPLGCVVGLSTILPNADKLPDEIASRPPVLLLHGQLDGIVPVRYLGMSEEALKANGVQVTTKVFEHLGHEIDHQGLEMIRDFLVKHLVD